MHWPDPAQRPRIAEIRDNLIAHIAEAEREGWPGGHTTQDFDQEWVLPRGLALPGETLADALDRILACDCGLDIVEIPRCQHLQAPRERQRTC